MNKALLGFALCLAVSPAPAVDALDRASAEAFADAEIKPALAASGVPGAIIAIVKDGEILLAKGYGVSNIDTRAPVDGATTLFHLASIGKPMTAMATLQLVHQGSLALDRDVNDYLAQGGRGLHVTGDPLTLQNLLGHRAGFEDNLTHLFVDLGHDSSMNADEINRRLVLLRKPGTITAYDNQGFGTISLVLASVTGKPFATVLQQQVFDPIGMTHAHYMIGDWDSADVARCYVPLGPGLAKQCEYPVYREALRGAGGVAASAQDMGRFMNALLNGGVVDGEQAVPADVIADMTNPDTYRFKPGLVGGSRPFAWFNDTDRPEFAHSGHVPGFSSMMRLYPASKIGVLVSILGSGTQSYDAVPSTVVDYFLHYRARAPAVSEGMQKLESITERFRDRFVPTLPTWPQPQLEQGPDRVTQVEGIYVPAPHSRFLLNRLFELVANATVSRNAAGDLLLRDEPFHRVGADLYENDKHERIAFGEAGGHVVMVERMSAAQWEQHPEIAWKRVTLPAFLIAVLLWPSWLLYLRRSSPARPAAVLALLGFAAFFTGLVCEFQFVVWFRLVKGQQLVPLLWQALIVAGLAAMVIAALRGWSVARSPLRHLHAGLLTVAVLVIAGSYAVW